MSTFSRVVSLMLAFFALAAGAQSPKQPNPAPQTAVQAPASNPGNSAAPKAAPSPNSHRFVTSDNFYRPSPKPQPGTPVPSTAAPPASTPSPLTQPAMAAKPAISVPRVAASQPPAVNVSLPDSRTAQPASILPALIVSPASGAVSNAAVDYASGQLSVVAENAPLGFVLKLIASKTGAA